jgi:predicted permease
VAREREIAIRVAVGAGKGRLIRQLFTESLLLAIFGSVAGLAVGYAVLRSLMVLTEAPAWLNPAPDWRVALFALAAGSASALLFGLTPALQAARQRHRATIARQILVGAQVAASCVLLIVAGLLGRALDHAMTAHPGFEYRQVISIDPGLARHGYSPARAQAYLDTLQNRLRALPGVESVSLALSPPLGRRSEIAGVDMDGRAVRVQINRVDPQFFQTMKIPLLRGRNLMRGEPHAIVVSESLARGVWPGQDPLGKKFTMDEDYTVVGIAGSARLVKLEDSDSVEVYFPIAPADLPGTSVLVKTSAAPEDLARAVAAVTKSVDPASFPEVQLMKSGFRQKLRGAEYSALTVALLGSIADILACLGIVGVVAYAVSQRTREIGIRMALGARPAHILSVILRQFSLPVAAGLLAGVGGAAALSGLLRGQLYGIGNLDPMAYMGAIGVFAVTVAVAALWPARRALRVDPMRALRHE